MSHVCRLGLSLVGKTAQNPGQRSLSRPFLAEFLCVREFKASVELLESIRSGFLADCAILAARKSVEWRIF
jgi:hypothetical protein